MAAPLSRMAGVRGAIARKMTESLRTTAQLSFFGDCDAGRILEARAAWAANGVKIGVEDIILHNLAKVLLDFPTFNAVETDRGVEPQDAIHVACAIDLDTGLVAPAVMNVQDKSLVEIASARADLVRRARAGKLTVEEMACGTVTVSNLGLTRVRHFSPILNPPQQAILGFGRMTPTPVVRDAEIGVAAMMGVSLTVDHRVHDGAAAGAFLTALLERLERPETGLGLQVEA